MEKVHGRLHQRRSTVLSAGLDDPVVFSRSLNHLAPFEDVVGNGIAVAGDEDPAVGLDRDRAGLILLRTGGRSGEADVQAAVDVVARHRDIRVRGAEIRGTGDHDLAVGLDRDA